MVKKRSALTPIPDRHCRFSDRVPRRHACVRELFQGLGAFGGFTLDKYILAYTDPELAESRQYIDFHLGSAVVATVLALVSGLSEHPHQHPLQIPFRIISIIPMMIPHILFSVSWVLLLNPTNGSMNRFLREISRLQELALQYLFPAGNDSGGGPPGSAHRLSDHRAGDGAFDVSLEESSKVCGAARSNPFPRHLAGAESRDSGFRHPGHRPQPGLLRRALGHRHARKDIRAGDPHLPDPSPPGLRRTTARRPPSA